MKTAFVTGASGGLGSEVAKGFAQAGWHVLMGGRDPERLAQALEQVRAVAAPGVTVVGVTADLSLVSEARRAAAQVKRDATRLDVLVNCAEVVPAERTVTAEGIETAFATNVLAPFVLAQELKGLLGQSSPSRIVSCFGGSAKKLDLRDLQAEKGAYDGFEQYGRTKLCVALLTIELARRFVGAGITANAGWPGLVRDGGLKGLLLKPFMKRPEEAAAVMLWLAMDPAVEPVSGKIFGSLRGDFRREPAVPEQARDFAAAQRLYETCERLARVS